MASAYCLSCNHKCHCVGMGFHANTTECGCGCFDCRCKGLPLKLEEHMVKKIWNIICWPFKKIKEYLWTR